VRWIGRLLTEAFGASSFASAARTDAKVNAAAPSLFYHRLTNLCLAL